MPKHPSLLEQLSKASYGELFLLWITVNLSFAILYFTLATVSPINGPSGLIGADIWNRMADCLYFSMVTATSTGYGDSVPLGFSKVLTCMQTITALMIFALFVSKVVTHRQEDAIEEMSKLIKEVHTKTTR